MSATPILKLVISEPEFGDYDGSDGDGELVCPECESDNFKLYEDEDGIYACCSERGTEIDISVEE